MTASSSATNLFAKLRSPLGTALLEAEATWALRFGTGSRRELRARFEQAIAKTAAPRSLHALCDAIEREHSARYGAHALSREASDEAERDAAMTSDPALVRYEAKWRVALGRLLSAHPTRWALPGLSDSEVVDELTLRLIEAVRSRSSELSRHHRAGKEWGLNFLAAERRRLREGFRLKVVLADVTPILDRALTEEERLIELQTEACYELARERAEQSLSRPQRRWFAALKESANAGAFFQSSGNPNLAAASRLNGKHRSSAQRAFRELEQHFGRELRKVTG